MHIISSGEDHDAFSINHIQSLSVQSEPFVQELLHCGLCGMLLGDKLIIQLCNICSFLQYYLFKFCNCPLKHSYC